MHQHFGQLQRADVAGLERIARPGDDLNAMIAALTPGDTLVIQGLHVVETLVAVSGSEDQPITIRGDGAVIEHPDGRTAAGSEFALTITGSYLHFFDLVVGEAGKAIVCDGAHHVRFDRCVGQNTSTECWKIRAGSTYIYLYDCRADGGGIGGGGGTFGEGFYVGQASSNWPTPDVVPDDTHHVRMVRCYATRCNADGFDIKEGSHHVVLKDCMVDHTRGNAPPPGNALGDSGVYSRADDVQLVNMHVLGAPGAGIKPFDTAINSVTYGRRNEVWGGVVDGAGGAGVSSQQDDLKVYSNFRVSLATLGGRSDVVGGGWTDQYDPASFSELTWDSPADDYDITLQAHGASHALTGLDPITAADIGALSSIDVGYPFSAGAAFDYKLYGDKASNCLRTNATSTLAFSATNRTILVLIGYVTPGTYTGFKLHRTTAMSGGAGTYALYTSATLNSTSWARVGSAVSTSLTATGMLSQAYSLSIGQPSYVLLQITLSTAPSTYPVLSATPTATSTLVGLSGTTAPIAAASSGTTAPQTTINPTTGFTVLTQRPWVSLY